MCFTKICPKHILILYFLLQERAPPSLIKKQKKKVFPGLLEGIRRLEKYPSKNPSKPPMPLHRKEKIKWEINFQLLFPVSTTSPLPPPPKKRIAPIFPGRAFPARAGGGNGFQLISRSLSTVRHFFFFAAAAVVARRVKTFARFSNRCCQVQQET